MASDELPITKSSITIMPSSPTSSDPLAAICSSRSSSDSRPKTLDHRFYPHIIDLVFDFCAAAASTGDRSSLLLWRQVDTHWSERADAVLFAHVCVSSCGVWFTRPVIRAPDPSQPNSTQALPILHSASGPVSPWDESWKRSRDRLLSRLKFVRVLDQLSSVEFLARPIPYTDALDTDLTEAVSDVRVIRRPWSDITQVSAVVAVDVLELSNELLEKEDDPGQVEERFGWVSAVPFAKQSPDPYDDWAAVDAVLVVRMKRDWIREPLANLEPGVVIAYAALGVSTITVVFEVEAPKEGDDYDKGDDDEAILPRLAELFKWLWRPHKPLTLVGLEEADPRAFGLDLGSDVAAAVHDYIGTLGQITSSEGSTQVTFLSMMEYRRQIGQRDFDLYTSIQRRTHPSRPNSPPRPHSESTIPGLVARSLWIPEASKGDRSAVLSMRTVSKRWRWHIDSALFRHIRIEAKSTDEMPPEKELRRFAKRFRGLMDNVLSSSSEGDDSEGEQGLRNGAEVMVAGDGGEAGPLAEDEGTTDGAEDEDESESVVSSFQSEDLFAYYNMDAELYGRARLLGLEPRKANISVVSPAGRLPLLLEWWSIEPTREGFRAHATSTLALLHARVIDVAASNNDVDWNHLALLVNSITAPYTEVLRHLHPNTSRSKPITPRSSASVYVYVCDGTSAQPSLQTAPVCLITVPDTTDDPRFEFGSSVSITLNVLFDPTEQNSLQTTKYYAEDWFRDSMKVLNVLFTPVKTPRSISKAGHWAPSHPMATGPDDPRNMGFFWSFWASFLHISDHPPTTIRIVGLDDVPRSVLELRANVTAAEVQEMVCWNVLGAITRKYRPDLTPETMAGMAEDVEKTVEFMTFEEYRRYAGKDAWDVIELERGMRPEYWPRNSNPPSPTLEELGGMPEC